MMMRLSCQTIARRSAPLAAAAWAVPQQRRALSHHTAKSLASTATTTQQNIVPQSVKVADHAEIVSMFHTIDTEGDKEISPAEFAAAAPKLAKWGIIIDDASAEFRHLDSDASGYVSFAEFTEWFSAKRDEAAFLADAADRGASEGAAS